MFNKAEFYDADSILKYCSIASNCILLIKKNHMMYANLWGFLNKKTKNPTPNIIMFWKDKINKEIDMKSNLLVNPWVQR